MISVLMRNAFEERLREQADEWLRYLQGISVLLRRNRSESTFFLRVSNFFFFFFSFLHNGVQHIFNKVIY